MKQRTRAAASDAALVELGAEVVRRRQAKGLTQEETAHRANVSLRTLQNLEVGRLNPTYLTLRSIAKGLDVSLGLLVRD